MKCPNCGRENPPGIRFCVFCGTELPAEEKKAPTPAVPSRIAPAPSALPTRVAREISTPAPRPMGIVLVSTYQFCIGLGFLLFGLLLYLSRFLSFITKIAILRTVNQIIKALSPSAQELGIDLYSIIQQLGIRVPLKVEADRTLLLVTMLTLLILAFGILSIAGSIGLLFLTGWGRRTVLYLQTLLVAMSLVVLFSLAFNQALRASGVLPPLLPWPLLGIFIGLFIIFYLINPGLDQWFHEM